MREHKVHLIGAMMALALSAGPAVTASADPLWHGHRGGYAHGGHYHGYAAWPIGLVGAVVGTAAAIVTAPIALAAAVVNAPYYAPPPAAYGARAPAYYPPASAAPPGYYGAAPGAYAPPAYGAPAQSGYPAQQGYYYPPARPSQYYAPQQQYYAPSAASQYYAPPAGYGYQGAPDAGYYAYRR